MASDLINPSMSISSPESPKKRIAHHSQANLLALRDRVNFLSKEASKEAIHMTGLHQGLKKAIENKLNHDQTQLTRQRLHKIRQEETQMLQAHARSFRVRQHEQLRQIKECYRQMKRQETAELKAIKQNNKSFAEKMLSEEMTKKRDRIQMLKQCKENARSMNLQKSKQRKAEISRIKQQRKERQLKKQEEIDLQVQLLEKKEKTLMSSLSSSAEYDRLVESLADRTNKMSLQQFHRLLEQTSVKHQPDRQKMKSTLVEQLIKRNRSVPRTD